MSLPINLLLDKMRFMRKFIQITVSCLIIFLISSCTGFAPQDPAKTQLEVRQMQTYIFDVKDFKLVMKAMLNVLQDEGYIVQNVHLDLGFLTSTKEIDVETGYNRFWAFVGTGNARWLKTNIIDATANVTEFGDQTKVRVNFQLKRLDNFGNIVTVNQVQDPVFYQDFFSKVSKSIFIQKENL